MLFRLVDVGALSTTRAALDSALRGITPEGITPTYGLSVGDLDGDGIAARTLPGVHPRGAYFTRGSGHTKLGTYTEDADDYVEVMERLARKIDSAGDAVPQPVIMNSPASDVRVGLVSLGSCDAAVREAVDLMDERGLPVDYMRIRGFPFNEPVEAFLHAHDVNFVIEQNRDAQLRSLLLLETDIEKHRLRSVTDFGGVPLSAEVVIRGVLEGMAESGEFAVSVTHGAAE